MVWAQSSIIVMACSLQSATTASMSEIWPRMCESIKYFAPVAVAFFARSATSSVVVFIDLHKDRHTTDGMDGTGHRRQRKGVGQNCVSVTETRRP